MTTPKPPLSLESAIGLACKPLGGVTNASLHLGKDRYTVAHAANPNRSETLRVDDAMQLDQLCLDAGGGTPIFDYFRAFLAPEDGPRVSMFAHTAAMVRESSVLTGRLVGALEDGDISPTERRDLLESIELFRTSLGALAADLRASDE